MALCKVSPPSRSPPANDLAVLSNANLREIDVQEPAPDVV
jgi:hypothetical protein